MIGKSILAKTNLPTLMKSLDAGMLRQRVIANNIANANTPGFRRVEVSFEDEFRSALDRSKLKGARTDDGHMQLGRPRIGDVNARSFHPADGTLAGGVNNVDIDTEMAKLAENQIMYNFGIKFESGLFRKLNAAVQGKSVTQ